jgi:ferredoxin
MTVKQLDPGYLNGWVDGLLLNQTIIGPVERDGHFVFEPINKVSDMRLDYDVTALPPKKFLLPPKEVLMTFNNGAHYQSVFESDPFVLFGVHPYDVKAIAQMDRVFTEKQEDQHYLARRAKCSIVALDVLTISPNNFSGCMDAAVTQEGWDILLSKVGNVYLAEARTDKGQALMRYLAPTPAATPEQLKERERLWEKNKQDQQKHKLKCAPQDLPDLLNRNYEHPIWQERADQCFSCGACNIVCPTCYCFDVQDDVDWSLNCGTRCRSWDGCLLRDFATVAGGHNFRKRSAERFRHRFYRKAKYMPEKMGELTCVGCGRCVSACVPKISNPVEVYNTLWGD